MWGENGWVKETDQSIAESDNSACLTSPQQSYSHKNSEACWEFFFWIWENTKWAFPREKAGALLPFHSMHKSCLPPPQPLLWGYVYPKGQNGAAPKHNKHYSVWVSFYISLFYFLFCLKWPVPQEYNLFNRFFSFFFFFRSR